MGVEEKSAVEGELCKAMDMIMMQTSKIEKYESGAAENEKQVRELR